MRDLLAEWQAVSERLREAQSIALFLDFDGTLAPIVTDPSAVVVNRIARASLMRLRTNPQVQAWVISGRRLSDLRSVVAVPGLRYIGVHGGDTAEDGLPRQVTRTVSAARKELKSLLNGSQGIRIEDKEVAFAVHHRTAPDEEVVRARTLLDRVIQQSGNALRIVPGDRVWEVLPKEIRGKGAAVRRELRLRSAAALPIYVGNDGTDETAFAALADGITVRVGPARPTRAVYALRNAAEVGLFLEKLEEELRWKHRPDSNS